MEFFSDNITQAEMCGDHNIYLVQLGKRMDQFIPGSKSAHAKRRSSDTIVGEIEDLKKIIGEHILVIDAFKRFRETQKLWFLKT